MDRITLKNMIFFAYHGVYEQEKIEGQKFEIDLDMYVNLQAASRSDSLEDTIHYGEVYDLVKEIATNRRFDLIERLCGCICDEVLQKYELVEKAVVRIRKPSAPIDGKLDYPEVEVARER